VTGPDAPDHEVDRRGRILLGLAAVAVGFAAADNYVVVLALPDMMGSAGLSAEDLQRAAPIISGFLLGYVAMLRSSGASPTSVAGCRCSSARSSSSRSARW
jgi:hypothetical protein